MAEAGDELEHGEVDDEDAELRAEHAKAGEGQALLRVRREGGEDGGDGGVDAGVEHAAEDIGEGSIERSWRGGRGAGVKKVRVPKRAKGNAEPEEPRAALAPAAVGLVEDDAPDGGVECVREAGEQKDGACGCGGDAVDVGIELEEVKGDDAEDELAADFGGGVAEAAGEERLGVGEAVRGAISSARPSTLTASLNSCGLVRVAAEKSTPGSQAPEPAGPRG